MVARDHPVYGMVFLLVIAPIGAAVIVGALLLFGVEPHTVFLAGFTVRNGLESLGLQAPNAIGVLSTVFVWWVAIAASGFAWSRWRRRGTAQEHS